jgi:FCD domain
VIRQMQMARTDAHAFLSADLDFHVALANAAHNRVLVRAMVAIRDPLRKLMANRAIEEVERVGDLDGPIADHREILEAISDRSQQTQALKRILARGEVYLDGLQSRVGAGPALSSWCLADATSTRTRRGAAGPPVGRSGRGSSPVANHWLLPGENPKQVARTGTTPQRTFRASKTG